MARGVTIAGGLAVAGALLCACGKPAPGSGTTASSGAAPSAAPAGAEVLPHRRPGLWRQVVTMDGAAPQGPGMRFCVDAASDAKMSLAGSQMMRGERCPQPQFSRNLDGSLSFSSNCDMGGGREVQSSGVVKGDFNTSYTTEIHVVYSGLPVASMNGAHTMTIAATWQGPCAPGQRGGDVILPNGHTMNALAQPPQPAAAGGG